MEKKNICLNMRGACTKREIYGEPIEFYTEGTLTHENGTYVIEYVEKAESIEDDLTVRFTVDGSAVSLTCDGDMRADFFFEPHRRYITNYLTPEGSIEVALTPTRVESEMNIEGGRIDLAYVISVDGCATYSELSLDYKSAN